MVSTTKVFIQAKNSYHNMKMHENNTKNNFLNYYGNLSKSGHVDFSLEFKID